MNTQQEKPKLRSRQAILTAICIDIGMGEDETGRLKVAQLTGIGKATIDKACSERDLTASDTSDAIWALGATGKVDKHIDEWSRYFIAPQQKIITDGLIRHFTAGLDALQNGGRVRAKQVFNCAHCSQEMLPDMQSPTAVLLVCRNPMCLALRKGD